MYKFLTETKQNSPQINMMNMKLTNLGNGTIAVSGDFLPVWDALKSLEGWTWSENELVFNDVPVRIRQLEQKNVELERDNKAKAKSTIENDTLRKENESLKRTIQMAQIEISERDDHIDALKNENDELKWVIEAMKTKALAENDMVAIMEACKEEARMEILKTKMPRAEKVVGGNATTKKTNEGQKAKHMRFYEEKRRTMDS